MKAFIFDPMWDELVTEELHQKLADADVELIVVKDIAPLKECDELFEGDEERILCINPDYVGWKLDSSDYEAVPRLKGIFGAATSFSWIDMRHADASNIPVCNIRNFSTEAVAEWAVTMMHNVARKVPLLVKQGFPLDFDKDFMTYRGVQLSGRKVGIIGLGNIGGAIAKRCEGLGMEVAYWSLSEKDSHYTKKELKDLFAESDVIFPAMALNDESKKVITPELLRSMKPSAIFISVVHDLFDKEIILDMIKSGMLFGFGFEADPQSFNGYDGNVWAAPAYAWTTEESMNNSMERWIDNMIAASQNQFPNIVNKPSV